MPTILPLLCIFVPAADPTSLADRVSVLIANKSKVPNRYAIRLRVEGRVPTAQAPAHTEWSANIHVWRDGAKLRVDQFDVEYVPPRSNHDTKHRRVACENCERDGYGILTTVQFGTPVVLHKVEFHRIGTFPTDIACTALDWRFLGLANADTCGYARSHIATDFPKFFGLPGVTSRAEKRSGRSCIMASRSVAMNKASWSVWLSESDAMNPVYFEDTFETAGVPGFRKTEIEWQSTPGGHLFPKRLTNHSMFTIDGAKSESIQTLVVSHADFEGAIDPAVFTVAGFGLNEKSTHRLSGTQARRSTSLENGKVDYSETAAKQAASGNAAMPQAVAPYPVESNLSSIIGICAGVLAVVTAVTALVLRRRRNAA
ncbi:MAG: hypothetical protein U0791_15420 [Gemmataceae bacterium]